MNEAHDEFRGEVQGDVHGEPSLDELVAYAENRLLPAERARIAAFVAAHPRTASLLAELGVEPIAGTKPVPGLRRWIAAAALLLAALSAVVYLLTSRGPTHTVDVAFARATQFAVLGDVNGTQRGGGSGADTDANDIARIVARPGAAITVSVVVPSTAHAWFLAVDRAASTVETLVDTAIPSDGDRLAVGRWTAPAAVDSASRWVVMLVAQRAFEPEVRARVEQAIRDADGVPSLRATLLREIGCIVDVRELVVQAAPPRKVGALERGPAPVQRELQTRLLAVMASPTREPSAIAALRADAASAVASAIAADGATHESTLRLRHFAARIELTVGDAPDLALLALDSLAADVRDAGLETSKLGASIESDLAGACRRLGQNETALRHARSALATYERVDADPRVIAETLRGLADLHRESGDADDARAYGDAAAALLEGSPTTADVHERLLHLHLSRASTELRFAEHQRAIEIAAEHVMLARACVDRMPNPTREGTVLAYEIEVAKRRGDRAQALVKIEALRAHDRARHGEDHPLTAMSDALLAREWLVDGRRQEARVLLESTLSRLERRLLGLADARDRVTMAESLELEPLIEDLVACCLAEDDAAAALGALERGRSLAWRAWLSRTALGDAELQALRAIRKDKAAVHLELSVLEREPTALSTADAESLRRRLVDLHHAEANEERRLARALHVPDPVESSTTSTSAVFARAVEGGRGVAWFERGPDGLRLFWLESSGSGPRIDVAPLASDAAGLRALDELVQATERSWCDPSVPVAVLREQLASLRTMLLPPALSARWSAMRSIAIVVDGPLARLPFEAIAEDLPPVTYVPSLSASCVLWMASSAREVTAARVRDVLLAGFGDVHARDPLQREAAILAADDAAGVGAATARAALPQIDVELDLVSGLWREHGATVHALRGAEATATAILQAACNYDLVHVAGHGRRADPALPYSAGSQLAPQDEAPLTASLLNAKAVLLGLRADGQRTRCVVLASCDSGRATEDRFATLTLPSALLARGVRSVVASLHPVESASTVQWMAAFHAALAARADGDALFAVHDTQRRMRDRFDDPRVSLAFQHHGPGVAPR